MAGLLGGGSVAAGAYPAKNDNVGNDLPSIYTFDTLPPATLYSTGTRAYTSDQGPVYTNGSYWSTYDPPTNFGVERMPVYNDNASLGYTTSSVWQWKGTIYTPSAYCGNDSAMWAPSNESAIDTPVDVMTTAVTKFAGGTVSMLAGFTGPGIDIAVTIGGVYKIFTINILSSGELDNVAMGAAISQADAGTNIRCIKVYDQTGNGNHATPPSAAGVPIVINGTVSGNTTLTVNSVTSGTVVTGLTIFGNGIVPGTTISSGTGPYTLSQSNAANPGPEVMYLGTTSAPYIDWDPILGRYCFWSPAEQGLNASYNQRALQIPQTATFTSSQNVGMYAVGRGATGLLTVAPVVCTIGDNTVSPNKYESIYVNGNSGSSVLLYGQAGINDSGSAKGLVNQFTSQPMVITVSTASSNPYATCHINEQLGTTPNSITNNALAGGWIFNTGNQAGFGAMKLCALAMFNAAPTAAQDQAMRRGAYVRFNIYPQTVDQIALIGDSRLGNYLSAPGFGTSDILPRLVGRNFDVLNLSPANNTVVHNIGDGLVPTVTGVAKTLANCKRSGYNYAVILLGVNDLGLSSQSVAQVVANLQTLCAQINAAGWTPVLIAELSTTQTTGSNPSVLLPLLRQAIVQAGPTGMNATTVIDMYGLTPIVTPANTAFYVDGLHPTMALHELISSVLNNYM